MASLVVGSKKFSVNLSGEFKNLSFSISPEPFRGVRSSIVLDVMNDFVDILVKAESLIREKSIPSKFHDAMVKKDILHGEEWHDSKYQVIYLKETRGFWEEKYSLVEMKWMLDFKYFIAEIDGKVGKEWFRLFETVRGALPEEYPSSLSFSVMLENIYLRKAIKYINRTVREYFLEHPEAIESLCRFEIPEDLPLMPEIGLTVEEFSKQAAVKKFGRFSEDI